ncbi:gas vesicle protein GvpG [Wolbachia endosymbiont of Psylliodes chrysocephala]|uniref:gas vesicle protein GvpG n=1 Tax=Wolbachia endosymbiont of Psylliodes chrysocephala TaxID=2883236 RepID=UPI00209DFC59|nr:gas vesicle protein GvpG [Wolbachia endosymbiont of Psylliodes chrysocephala]
MLKEKKEKNLIAAIMKFLRDKLKELIKKIFARDLSFDQRLDKEIKELQEKLGSGELSEEEFARALERLTALQDLKLRLQMAVTGWIITMFAEMFGVELAAAVEASTEKEDKKAEKTSLKEENKEVCENVEMKVDEREKPKVPVSLFEVSPGFVRPVPLSKPERNLLPDFLKIPMDLSHRQVINNENNKSSQGSRVKGGEVKPENLIAMCPSKPAEQPVVSGIKFYSDILECVNFQDRRSNAGVNGGITLNNGEENKSAMPPTSRQGNKLNNEKKNGSASCAESRLNGNVNSVNKEGIKSTNEQDEFDAKLAKKVANFKIGVWNGAENEGSVNNAQAKVSSELTGPKANNLVEGQSVGKT